MIKWSIIAYNFFDTYIHQMPNQNYQKFSYFKKNSLNIEKSTYPVI